MRKQATAQEVPEPKREFYQVVEQGVQAYRHTKGLRLTGQTVKFIAEEAAIGASTLDGWRSKTYKRIPRDYAVLRAFAATCVKAAPELGEAWITELFLKAEMARFCEQALAEILPQPRTTLAETVAAYSAAVNVDSTSPIPHLGSVPNLPDYYIARTAKLQQIKALTLAAQDVGGWGAVLGMTGVGKSTLLAALGHDSDINTAFSSNVRWFEIRQSTAPQWLIRQIARSFDKQLPREIESTTDAVAALRVALQEDFVLLLLDNVANPEALRALRALGSNVVVVITTRAMQDATVLHIPEKAWVTVAELTPNEAWTLVERIAPIPDEQIAAAREVIEILEYHPYIITIAACTALTLHMSWPEIREALCTITARLRVLRFLEAESVNVWAPLEMDWERLDKLRQLAVTTLGQLPYFMHYDLALACAAWRIPESEAALIWKELVAMQLARPVTEAPTCYAVHWLVRDFGGEKARNWSPWQRLRFALWPWRYRLPFSLHWWWPVLPKPDTEKPWPWWSPTVPHTEEESGWHSIFVWLTKTLWRHDGRNLNLRAGPVEWVTVTRLSVRFILVAVILVNACIYGGSRLVLSHSIPVWILFSLLAMVWIILVTYADLRRAVLLWGTGTLPQLSSEMASRREKGPG